MNPEKQFPVTVFEKDHLYYCIIKELSILEKGENLHQVYEAVQRKKQETLKQFKQANLSDFWSPSKETRTSKKRWANFSLNFLLLSLFLVVPVVSLTRPLSVVLSRLAGVLQLKPMEFVIHVNEHLEQMPAEKKMEFKKALHSLLVQFDELKEKS